jgi:hypothetical protein
LRTHSIRKFLPFRYRLTANGPPGSPRSEI